MTYQQTKFRRLLLFFAVALLTSLHTTAANRDSLALTPPMGFMGSVLKPSCKPTLLSTQFHKPI